jgi:hypothetical protein
MLSMPTLHPRFAHSWSTAKRKRSVARPRVETALHEVEPLQKRNAKLPALPGGSKCCATSDTELQQQHAVVIFLETNCRRPIVAGSDLLGKCNNRFHYRNAVT